MYKKVLQIRSSYVIFYLERRTYMVVKVKNDNGNYDQQKVMELLFAAAGDRSFRQFAIDAGLSPGYLYRVKSGDYRLTPDVIRRLTSAAANPQGNIGYEDLMRAAGYQDDNQERMMSWSDEVTPDAKHRRMWKEREIKAKEFKNVAEGIVLKSLLNKEIEFTSAAEVEDKSSIGRVRTDIKLKLKKEEIKEWWIEFKFLDESRKSSRMMGRRIINLIFGNLLATPSKKTRKISIAVNDSVFFNQIAEYKNQTSYRGELSVILIDTDNFKIVKEVYLSHFDENDKSMEIKLS